MCGKMSKDVAMQMYVEELQQVTNLLFNLSQPSVMFVQCVSP